MVRVVAVPVAKLEECPAEVHFFGFEGCADNAGSCYGTCTHVWGYEHCLVDLWPELARDLLDQCYGPRLDLDTGHMCFRVGLPLATKARASRLAAADGQMQMLVRAYEYWQKSGDTAWLKAKYPFVRKALEFCWIAGNFAAAEQVVRDIRDRYDGKKRNPFDETECGHHYVRAMAAWSVLKAFETFKEGRSPLKR